MALRESFSPSQLVQNTYIEQSSKASITKVFAQSLATLTLGNANIAVNTAIPVGVAVYKTANFNITKPFILTEKSSVALTLVFMNSINGVNPQLCQPVFTLYKNQNITLATYTYTKQIDYKSTFESSIVSLNFKNSNPNDLTILPTDTLYFTFNFNMAALDANIQPSANSNIGMAITTIED
jgi:hypothetical protein